MKVTRESFQERLNMKKITPVAFTTLRRKMLMFWETRSLTMVVSDVRREMTSPAATRGQGRVTTAGHCQTTSHIHARGQMELSIQPAGGLKGGMEGGQLSTAVDAKQNRGAWIAACARSRRWHLKA